VAQELLDNPDIRPALQQMRCERMPQGVRRNAFGDVGFIRGGLEDGPGALAADPSAARVQEQRRGAIAFAARSGRPRTR
jgi:hypothetical protein